MEGGGVGVEGQVGDARGSRVEWQAGAERTPLKYICRVGQGGRIISRERERKIYTKEERREIKEV